MKNTRNILIIGRTGSGKSTLGNVLINKNNNFEEVFEEVNSTVSETKNVKSGEVNINGFDYRIIDTIGIGNTRSTDEEIVYSIIEACREFKEGLNQVLFAIRGRIVLEEIKFYNIMMKKFFGEEISKCTTIVRTDFYNFRDWEKCSRDHEFLKKENRKISKLVKMCSKVVYVDNPSLNPKYFDKEEIVANKKRREDSRNILIDRLNTCSKGIYKPISLEIMDKILKKYDISQDSQSNDKFIGVLKSKIERLKSRGFFEKNAENLERIKKKILREKEKTEEEVENSLLQAAIEIRSNCKQM